jgi:hypothetical protein
MGANTTTGMTKIKLDDMDMVKALPLSHPPIDKEDKPSNRVMPSLVRIFWQDNDATDSSDDEENIQWDDGKTNSGRRRIKYYGCEIKMKHEKVTMSGKVNSEEIVRAKRARLNG